MQRAPSPSRVIALAVLTLLLATATEADIFDVTHLGDSGPESLRQAIIDANALAGRDIILFYPDLSGTLELQSGLPHLLEQADLIGPGAAQLTIDANYQAPVLVLIGSNGDSFTIRGLTLTGGESIGQGGAGISLNTGQNLLLEDVHLVANHAEPAHLGGGLLAFNETNVTIRESIISHNRADRGGGIFSVSSLTVENSTLYSNEGAEGGGAIYVSGGSLILHESTVHGNTAPGGGGGGIYLYQGSYLEASSVTIARNSSLFGPGINRSNDSQVGDIGNSIIAYNHYYGGGWGNCNGSLGILDEANLSSDTSCGFLGASDFDGVDPELLPLAWAGGPTPTMVPKPGSPVLDEGKAIHCTAIDQRGLPRPTDGDDNPGALCDLGAVEYQPSGEPFLISFDGFESGDTTKWSSSVP